MVTIWDIEECRLHMSGLCLDLTDAEDFNSSSCWMQVKARGRGKWVVTGHNSVIDHNRNEVRTSQKQRPLSLYPRQHKAAKKPFLFG